VVSRRDVLKSAAAGAGLVLAIPMLSTVAHADDPAPTPAAPAKPDVWKAAGDPADFKANLPVRVDLGVTVAWVTRLDDKNMEAVSAHCTHRGCELGYDPQSTNLVCPCHGGTFKIDGSNVVGTRHDPSTPLPHLLALPSRIKDGQVQVNVAALS
jgi:nitrite reductase/ring-hydroxylating ferredoxin subunit